MTATSSCGTIGHEVGDEGSFLDKVETKELMMFVLQNRQDGLYLAQNYCGWTEDLNCAKIFDTVKDAGLRRGEDFTLEIFSVKIEKVKQVG